MRNLLVCSMLTLFLFGCSSKQNDTSVNLDKSNQESSKTSILFIVSNQHTYGDTEIGTSNHFAEIVLAYDLLINEGYSVDFVSPKGGAIPIGYLDTSDSIQKQYIYDSNFMNKLKNTHRPDGILASNYKAVYYSGGGAAMFGVPEDEKIQNIVTKIYENNGIISAICHGTAGIVNLKNNDGTYIYEGKKINGFPDFFENKEARYYKEFPFSIEGILKERGGDFSYSEKGWDNYFVVDGRLISGQDPTASASVARKIIETLQNK